MVKNLHCVQLVDTKIQTKSNQPRLLNAVKRDLTLALAEALGF